MLGRFDDSLIDQQNWNVISHRIHPVTSHALEAVIVLDLQRLFARRAYKNVEKTLCDHRYHSSAQGNLLSGV